ncbi:MAG TPA: hypothetical protein VGU67_05425 [Edaphobacter sp.]|nr:hypothetical protein [Edaphobacter sp.]
MIVPIALLALLMCTTLGTVWHHHVTTSPDTCPICHLSHLAIEPSVASVPVSVPAPTGMELEPQHISFTRNSSPRHIPARAPPA